MSTLLVPFVLAAAPVGLADGQDGPSRAVAAPEASAAEPSIAARGKGGIVVRMDELDRVLLERFGGAEDGRELLDLLIKARLLETLADKAGVEIAPAEVSQRWAELDRRMRAAGETRGLAAEIERRRLSIEEFRDFLRLSIVQERLTRRALEREEDTVVSGDEQDVWLRREMQHRGLDRPAPPWEEGVAARCGEVLIGTDELATFLRRRLPREDVREACWHLLLQKGLERRMPDLSPEAKSRGIDVEIERRRAKHRAELPAIRFEDRLGATGRTIELLRRDPSVQIAALSRIWVDRDQGPDGLRETYEAERAFFEGRFGLAVRTHMIFLIAGRFVNDLNARTFETADEELAELQGRIGNLDDFKALAGRLSEEPATKSKQGALGWVTRRDPRVPAALREAVFEFLDTGGRIPTEGCAVGPVRTDAGCALLWVSGERESPSWEVMSERVHEELRRRLVEEAMPMQSVVVLVEETH